MTMSFDLVRNALLNPFNGQDRKELVLAASRIKPLAGFALGVGGFITVVSLATAISFPIIGTLGLTLGIAIAVVGKDVYTMCQNVEGMFNDKGWTGNLISRAKNAVSPDSFVQSLFQNTWICGLLFSSLVLNSLNE